jgi:hypothetical protein
MCGKYHTMTERTTSTTITERQLKQALPKLQTALDAFQRGVRIYRGLSHSDSKYRHKAQMQFGQRVSANTDNYYTLVVDHDPAWSDYPPRSSSIIASSKLHVAGGYGTPYVVLCEGDPQIGICSEADYWVSFPRVRAIQGHTDLSDLNMIIRDLAHKYAAIPRLVAPDFRYLTQILEIIDEQLAAEGIDWQSHVNSSDWRIQQAAQFMTKTPDGTILERLQWLLNPDANGFSHAHLSEMSPLTDNRELWMHASIYMIRVDQLPPDWQDPQFDLKSWIAQL